MGKIVKNITLAAIFAIAVSGCVPAYGEDIALGGKTTGFFAPLDTLYKSKALAWTNLGMGTLLAYLQWRDYMAGKKGSNLSHPIISLVMGGLPLWAKLTKYDKNESALPTTVCSLATELNFVQRAVTNPSVKSIFGGLSWLTSLYESPATGVCKAVSNYTNPDGTIAKTLPIITHILADQINTFFWPNNSKISKYKDKQQNGKITTIAETPQN